MFVSTTSTHRLTVDELAENFANICPSSEISFKQRRPYASQAGFCARMSSIKGQLEDHEVPRSKSLNFYAEIGRTIENHAIRIYRDAEQLVTNSYKLPEYLFEGLFNLGGEIDAFIEVSGELCMIDIKTTGIVDGAAYLKLTYEELQALENNDSITISPPLEKGKLSLPAMSSIPPSYRAQMQVYSAITGIDNVYLQYFSRRIQDSFSPHDSSPSQAFFPVKISDDILTKRIASIIYTVKCVENNVIAKMPIGIKRSHCNKSFCPFQDYCWHDSFLPEDLPVIDDKLEKELKTESLEIARDYISRRPERAEKVKKEIYHLKKIIDRKE